MTKIEKTWVSGVLLAVILSFATVASANPSAFANGVTTNNAASTTPAYMTPGTATSTTPTYNAYSQTTNGGLTSKADYAGVLVQFTGSSTAATLTLSVEYSQDGMDWYRNYVIDPLQVGTTSQPSTIGSPNSLQWKFASSTIGGSGTTTNRTTAAFVIPTPFQYTRIVSSITGANGSVWVQIVPSKQIK